MSDAYIPNSRPVPRHGYVGDRRDHDGGVRQLEVPRSARELSTLAHIDYADAFLIDIRDPKARTAEHWAREIFDDPPSTLRLRMWSAWTMMLGLRLGSPFSKRFVLGWEVRRSTPDHVLLGAGSRIGMPAQLLVKREEHALLFDTFVQKDNAIARAMWASIEPTHQWFVPTLLRQFRRRACDPEAPHTVNATAQCSSWTD
jgi:hypothetical protein